MRTRKTLQNPAIFCNILQNPTKPDIFRLSCFPVNGDLTAKQFGSREEAVRNRGSEDSARKQNRSYRRFIGEKSANFAC